MLNELKQFLEDSELAKKATKSIADGREIGLVIRRTDGQIQNYVFQKSRGTNVVRESEGSAREDIVFTIPEAAARELVTQNFESISQVGLRIFEKILSNEPAQRIEVKLKTGFMGILTGGYLGVLATGGSEIAGFLAKNGFGSMGKIKDVVSKLRDNK